MASEKIVSFVEWKEQFVSKERGARIVHYILKESGGESVLAVVGTERSLRHMVYVIADEFLDFYGDESQVQPGFKWRTRREVIDWLTSMLSKQKLQDSPGDNSALAFGASEFSLDRLTGCGIHIANSMDRQVKRLKQPTSDIEWLGAAWSCGKQLKHFPAFCRNGTKIAIQSFVFVMAKEETRYLAYLEDLYEDKKGQKKVKVRWFHYSKEVKGVNRIRNAHPKEVFISPNTQVISAECVDGLAIILTQKHFEKCVASLPQAFLAKVHLCFRQFKSNKIKPFDLSKLRGYSNQPILSCLESDTFLNLDKICAGLTECEEKALGIGLNANKGTKRTRNFGGHNRLLPTSSDVPTSSLRMSKIMHKSSSEEARGNLDGRSLLSIKNFESQYLYSPPFKVDMKIELLCQDSGIRGCWFRCTVLEIVRKRIKVQYDDLEDQDGCGNLKEWVPAYRLAAPDKLGMRYPGRPRIRPSRPTTDLADTCYEVGSAVDAWWNDGWWEGVLTSLNVSEDDRMQVYLPGENFFINVLRENLRVSREWIGGKWADVEAKPDILSSISAVMGTKVSESSGVPKDDKSDSFATSTGDVLPLKAEEHTITAGRADLVDSAPSGGVEPNLVGEQDDTAVPDVLPTSVVIGHESELFAAPNADKPNILVRSNDDAPLQTDVDNVKNVEHDCSPSSQGNVDLPRDVYQPCVEDHVKEDDSDRVDSNSDDSEDKVDIMVTEIAAADDGSKDQVDKMDTETAAADDSEDGDKIDSMITEKSEVAAADVSQDKVDKIITEIVADENGAEPMQMEV